jgi:hypothetical protein
MAKPRIVHDAVDALAHWQKREALGAAISNHTALKQELDDNKAGAQRAEDAKFAAIRAADAASKAVEVGKIADAESIAAGRPTGAAKAARGALADADDEVESARSATKLLAKQHSDLTNRLAIANGRVNDAIAAVVVADPAVREICEEFRAAQMRLHDLHSALSQLGLPDARNVEAWKDTGLPEYSRAWDAQNWRDSLPPSILAEKVQAWIAALRSDAFAVLDVPK